MKAWCWNNRSEPAAGYWACDTILGRDMQRIRRTVWIPNVMSRECGQPGKDLPPADECLGCKELSDA